MAITMIREFMKREAAGGLVLMFSAALALVIANSPLYPWYDKLLNVYFEIGFAKNSGEIYNAFGISKPLVYWINDGLMAIFFLLVGLEIKREFLVGELSSKERMALPVMGAIGGMAIPALVFMAINYGETEYYVGWAIPAATDIAFALGILSLLGPRVPVGLKVLLTALAILDDVGAIIIIALFYTADLTPLALAFAAMGTLILFIMNRRGVSSIGAYILVGIIIWFSVLKSGVHATLAGVVVAMFIPMTNKHDKKDSPVQTLEHYLTPYVAFFVLPFFGFANAGVRFADISLEQLFDELTLGIVGGLFIGKQLGIFGMLWLTIKLGLAPMLPNVNWKQLYAMSLFCGIGFTMSLFIGKLAFTDPVYINEVRIGVLIASLLSASLGYILMRTTCKEPINPKTRNKDYQDLGGDNRKHSVFPEVKK